MKNISLYMLLFILLFGGCKKTKLDGELSVLVGTWEWKNTIRQDDICTPYIENDVVTHSPAIDGYTYSLTFHEKGKLTIKKNGKKEKTYRITNQPPYIPFVFSFFLDNKKKKGIIIIYKNDNGHEYIHTNYFPQGVLNGFDGCVIEQSYFDKRN